MRTPPEPAIRALERAARSEGKVVVLTGAGISAESGIPTFRGPGGYWTVGSVNYRAEELGTRAAFERLPEDLWAWYLYRRGVCRAAEPNAAHHALVRLEERLLERFVLVTQNIDGLHARAGSTRARTLEIHGNPEFMRCSRACIGERPEALVPLPDALPTVWPKGSRSSEGAPRRRISPCS